MRVVVVRLPDPPQLGERAMFDRDEQKHERPEREEP
jgi:hypothetical protein